MSPLAQHLVEQCVFWLDRARAGSVNAGRPEFWEAECRRVAIELINAGCVPESTQRRGAAAAN